MKFNGTIAAAAFACAALASGMAHASIPLTSLSAPSPNASTVDVSVGFPSSSTFYHTAAYGDGYIPPGGQSDPMFTAGDYITQTFTGTGLDDVSSLTANFSFQDFLGDGNTETWSVLINGTNVAQFNFPDDNYNGDIGTVSGTVSFAPIAGAGTYTLRFELQNTVPFGGGAASFLDGGMMTLTGTPAVPEPGTWAMMLAGFGLIGFVLRGRTTAAGHSA